MSLSKRIQAELVQAMKARESELVGVLRLIKTAIKNKEIDVGRELNTDEENQLLQTMVKQRNEAIENFEKGGRDELAQKEAAEKVIIQKYLPEEVTPEEVAAAVSSAIEETGASTAKDMGRVMKATMARLKETGKTVDGKAVNAAVRAKLS